MVADAISREKACRLIDDSDNEKAFICLDENFWPFSLSSLDMNLNSVLSYILTFWNNSHVSR